MIAGEMEQESRLPSSIGPIRPVLQMERADCGAACLTMVLSGFGKHLPLSRVRVLLDGGRDGVTALDIVRAARHFGLKGGGYAVPVAQLSELPTGTILHWEKVHFVVLLQANARGAQILDPATGRRNLSHEELVRGYSGVALVLEPAQDFQKEGTAGQSFVQPLLKMLLNAGQWGRITARSLGLQGLGLALPLLTGVLVDQVVPAGDRSLWTLVCLSVGIFAVVHPVMTLIRGHLLLKMRNRLDSDLGHQLLHQLTLLPYSFFMRRAAGDLMMRLQSNVAIRQILSAAALSAIIDTTLVFSYLLLVTMLAPKLAALVVLLGILQLGVFIATRRRRRELLSRAQATQAAKAEYEAQLLANMETVKAAGAEKRAEERWNHLFEAALAVEQERGWLETVSESISTSVRMATPLVILVYGVDQVMKGTLSLGEMLSLNTLAIASVAPLAGLVSTASQLAMLGGYLERIDDVMQTTPEQDFSAVKPAPPLQGAITLRDVSFRFSPLLDDSLRKINLQIAPGSFVAIVGPSGAGKSTLARLLSGLHIPSAGQVLFDGIDLSTLDLATVRRQVGVVSQRPELLGTDVLEALRFGAPEASEAEVIEACKMAAIHDEIAALPMGYQTGLSTGGSSFSGGQTQRLALARALVSRPRVVILDEATSALDGLAEQKIQASLETLDCTRIVLAHRLSTIRRADQIVVLDQGEVVETGTHETLMQAGGVYARLMSAQIEEEAHAG